MRTQKTTGTPKRKSKTAPPRRAGRAAAKLASAPDVTFDVDTGRMRILNESLGRKIRLFLNYPDHAGGQNGAVIRISPIAPAPLQDDPGVIVDARC